MTQDELIRRALVEDINCTAAGRQALEKARGQVWDSDELQRDFEVIQFLAPFVFVKRRSDGKEGTVVFQHNPRFYWGFE